MVKGFQEISHKNIILTKRVQQRNNPNTFTRLWVLQTPLNHLILRGLFINIGQINTICTTFAQESARKWLLFFFFYSTFFIDCKFIIYSQIELFLSQENQINEKGTVSLNRQTIPWTHLSKYNHLYLDQEVK